MPFAERPVRRNGKREHDTKAPDGFTVYGWRKICKGGYVRFAALRHYCHEFTGWEGHWVYVTLDDPWGLNVQVFMEKPWEGRAVLCANEKDWFSEEPEAAPKRTRGIGNQ